MRLSRSPCWSSWWRPSPARPHNAGQRSGDALAYVLALPLTLPFAVHRRWPMGSLGVVLGTFTIFAVADYAVYPGLSLFAILYGIAAHTDRRRSLIALGLCSAAMIIALTTQPAHVVTSADRTSSLLAIAVAWLAGENSRSRRARWVALEERATMLENEREERDRRAVADERLRIARDLHDIVSHAMSVVAVQAGAGKHLLDSDPEAARRGPVERRDGESGSLDRDAQDARSVARRRRCTRIQNAGSRPVESHRPRRSGPRHRSRRLADHRWRHSRIADQRRPGCVPDRAGVVDQRDEVRRPGRGRSRRVLSHRPAHRGDRRRPAVRSRADGVDSTGSWLHRHARTRSGLRRRLRRRARDHRAGSVSQCGFH